MQFKTLALFFLSAGSLAFAAQEKRQFELPSSIEAVLITAVPESILTNFPAASAALESSIEAGNIPGWYQSLPADVKSYLVSAFGGGAQPTGVSASGNSAITPAATPSGPSNTSRSSPVSSGGSGSSTSPGSSGSTSGANTGSSSSSSSSKAAAPAATAGIALGLAGAVGIFGVALIL